MISHQAEDHAFEACATASNDRVDNLPAPRFAAEDETFLDDVAGVLVSAVRLEVAADDFQDHRAIGISAMSDNMLDNVIAILIAHQAGNAIMQLAHDDLFVGHLALLETTLNDATTVRVRAENQHLSLERVEDKAECLLWAALNSLLDDVVAICILDTLQDLVLQLVYQLDLLIVQNMLE